MGEAWSPEDEVSRGDDHERVRLGEGVPFGVELDPAPPTADADEERVVLVFEDREHLAEGLPHPPARQRDGDELAAVFEGQELLEDLHHAGRERGLGEEEGAVLAAHHDVVHVPDPKVREVIPGVDLRTGVHVAVEALDRERGEDGASVGVALGAAAAPYDLGATLLGGVVARYPKVRVEVDLTSRMIDLAAEGVDVALRPDRGKHKAPHSRRAGSWREES